MDHQHHELSEKEGSERRNSNTEYLPTKCRITKPPPPKPATNPLQFIKVAPCPLFQKAKEQIKKVEEIKSVKQEVRDEAEDWQQNLDNWKSSRRKRQEHIIERVVEVKKFEQEEQEKGRRKSKTFSEMMEERNKRGHRLNIPIYDDDSNDLSDYGIGSSSSKTNSIKDVDTDDSSSLLDEKEHVMNVHYTKDASSASNQSQSEDEVSKPCDTKNRTVESGVVSSSITTNYSSNLYATFSSKPTVPTKPLSKCILDVNTDLKVDTQQYTYEGAIQDYRSRIRSKIKVDESIFTKQDYLKTKDNEIQKSLPKVDIYKRKEIFEVEKPLEIHHFETTVSRRLSEDFANTRSIKDRLKSLEKCTDQTIRSIDKGNSQSGSVKSKIQNFNKSVHDVKNNNIENVKPFKESPTSPSKSISSYLLDPLNSNLNSENHTKSNLDWLSRDETLDRCSSPEAEMYMNKLNMFNRDLDAFLGKSSPNFPNVSDNLSEHSNYPASTSSTELTGGLSSDREDSGIHTADVSCSVSQADEPVEDTDLSSTTIPSCIEKLNSEKEKMDSQTDKLQDEKVEDDNFIESNTDIDVVEATQPKCDIRNVTKDFLKSLQDEANMNYSIEKEYNESNKSHIQKNEEKIPQVPVRSQTKSAVYENFTPLAYTLDDAVINSPFPLAPPKTIEPPKEKPPPPPPPEEEESLAKPKANIKRLNSTKRIKKEMHIKRSSFLGLDEPTDDQIDPEVPIDKPPDINSFLQKESQLEKSLYKKLQGNRDVILSEVESQDSGLECERGRLSSDTWCSSYGDSSTPSHGRQDSEHTSSVTSEEDEIAKKEREIIEMVEKEEKSRDADYSSQNNSFDGGKSQTPPNRNFNYNPSSRDDQDSEVLKVEHELLQLEREEIERKRENAIFRESRAKMYRNQNQRSLENICDILGPYNYSGGSNNRKSLPELQHTLNSHQEYRKSVPDVPNFYSKPQDVDLQYRKSMPDIQQAYLKAGVDLRKKPITTHFPLEHRKSLPDLQQDVQMSAFKAPSVHRQQPIMPGKPLRPLMKDQRDKERFMMMNHPVESDALHYQNGKMGRPIGRPGLHALSAVPKSKHIPNDNWIQPKANENKKSYNQHWLYQEAELRRIADQQKNAASRNWSNSRQEKHIPEPIIQTLTQRVQSRTVQSDRNQVFRRQETSPKTELGQIPFFHPRTIGHALPISYPSPATLEESQGKMLSVSGKKKCSHCGIELGRGAAMIVESLRLFYHIECFKCIVCHVQLGDGLMGIDVRVRNHKLHCHNCYSSDDGVKLSCV